MRSPVAAAVLLVVVLAGCGGDDGDGADAAATVTVTAPAAAPPAATTPSGAGGGVGAETVDPARVRARLEVAADGCAVARTGPAPEPRGLQWSVTDGDGVEVLARNALGETRYRYYRPGGYRVVLQAWDGERYAPVSNVVAIRC